MMIFPLKMVIFLWKMVIFPWKMVIFPWKNGDFPMENGDFPMEIISSSNAGGATEPSPKIVAAAEERGMMIFGRGKWGKRDT